MISENWFREAARENKSGIVNFHGYFLTTTNGTLNVTLRDAPGFILIRVSAGRYLIQMVNSKGENIVFGPTPNAKATTALVKFGATIIAPAGEVTAGRGIQCYIRDPVALGTLGTQGNFQIQFATGANPPVDGDVEDGAALLISFSLKRGSAVP